MQVGLSLVLLVCAGLLFHSVHRLRWDPGFDAGKVVFFRIKPRLSGYDERTERAYLDNVRRRLESLAEVESVAFARWPPALRTGTIPVSLPRPRVRTTALAPEFIAIKERCLQLLTTNSPSAPLDAAA